MEENKNAVDTSDSLENLEEDLKNTVKHEESLQVPKSKKNSGPIGFLRRSSFAS